MTKNKKIQKCAKFFRQLLILQGTRRNGQPPKSQLLVTPTLK